MSPQAAAAVFPPQALTALGKVCDLAPLPALDDLTTARAREILAEVEVLVTGWGCPPLDAGVLASAPHLKAVVHAAGSVRGHVTDACWERGIEVSSAAAANALPVAEYTVAAIVLAAKRSFRQAAAYRTGTAQQGYPPGEDSGLSGSTVGVVLLLVLAHLVAGGDDPPVLEIGRAHV